MRSFLLNRLPFLRAQQVYITPALTRRVQIYINQAARAIMRAAPPKRRYSPKWPDMICYGLEPVKFNPELVGPEALQVVPLQSAEVLKIDVHTVAKHLANEIVATTNGLIPGFYQNTQTPFAYENTSAFYLRSLLALKEMNLYAQYLRTVGTRSARRPMTLLDGQMGSEHFRNFLKACGFRAGPKEITVASTMTSTLFTGELEKIRALSALPPPQLPFPGGVVAIIGSKIYLETLRGALEVLAVHYPVTLVMADKTVQIDDDLRQKLSVKQPLTLTALEIAPQPAALAQTLSFLQQRQSQVDALPEGNAQAFCYNQLRQMLSISHTFLSLDAILAQARPEAVLGCMDINLFGPIAMELQQQYPFKLLNFQHGSMRAAKTLDRLRFDRYFIWNEQTAALIRGEGYPAPASLRVVGNPTWDRLKQTLEAPETSGQYAELMQWKGESPLIVAYTQQVKGYSTYKVKRGFLNALLNYMKHDPQVKLLVKLHPTEDDDVAETMIKASGLGHRIQIKTAQALSLMDSLKAASLVTSVFSSTLLEAASLNIPTLAIDFERTLTQQNLQIKDAVPVVERPKQVKNTLKALLYPSKSLANLLEEDSLRRQNVLPVFQVDYPKRIEEALLECLAVPVG